MSNKNYRELAVTKVYQHSPVVARPQMKVSKVSSSQ